MTAERVAGPHWKLPPLRQGRPAADDLAARRAETEQRELDLSPCDGIKVEDTLIAGVRCLVHSADAPQSTVLFFHGGGYRMGAVRGWTPYACRLARAISGAVVVVEYRVAPEDPFPAALHDGALVLDALRESHPRPLIVMGDSAGGGLAVAVVAAACRAGLPVSDGLIAVSPWADLTVEAETYVSRAETDELFSAASAHESAEGYLQGYDPRDPLVSTTLGDFTGFPRTLAFAGGAEVLLDDTLNLATGIARAGGAVDLVVDEDMQHVYVTRTPDLPESVRAMATIQDFVSSLPR